MTKDMKLSFSTGNAITFNKEVLDDGSEKGRELSTFEMQGYSGAVMESPYGNLILDLSGMTSRSETTPIFQHHDNRKIVGHAKAEIGETVQLTGVVSGTGEAAQEVLETSANGFPWQASVGIEVFEMLEMKANTTNTINGIEVSGPITVISESQLYETSFVPLGRDKDTRSVIFSQDAEDAIGRLMAANETKEESDNMSDGNTKAKFTAEEMDAATQDATAQATQRLKDLNGEFSHEVALAAFEAGKSVDEVKLEQYGALQGEIVELKAEVEALKAAAKAGKPQAEGEEFALEHDEAKDGETEVDHMAEFKASMKKLGSFQAAMDANPELANKAFNVQ